MSGLEVIMPVVGSLGTLAGLAGSQQQFRAQEATAAAQAEAERMNARLAEVNAEITRNEGREAQAAAAVEAYKAMGRQRAALAQNGLISSPTGLLLQEESRRNADREQSRLSRQAELAALGYDLQRSNALTGSGLYQANAEAAGTGGRLALAGGLLSGVSKGVDHYFKYHSGPGRTGRAGQGKL